MKFLPALTAGYGATVAFLYFFGAIHFFPSGMNLGDTLLLMFIAAGYGMLALILVGSGLLLCTPGQSYLSGLHRSIESDASPSGKERFQVWALVGILVPIVTGGSMRFLASSCETLKSPTDIDLFGIATGHLVLSFALTYFGRRQGISNGVREVSVLGTPARAQPPLTRWEARVDFAIQVAMYFIVMGLSSSAIVFFGLDGAVVVFAVGSSGFLVLLVLVHKQRKPRGKNPHAHSSVRIMITAFALLFVPLYLDGSQLKMAMVSQVMEALGLRTTHATVRVTGGAYVNIVEAAESSELALRVCKSDDGSALVGPVDVLWHGLGARSLISLKGKHDLQVVSEQVSVIRGSQAMCHDLATAVNFESGKASPADSAQLALISDAIEKSSAPAENSKVDDWVLSRLVISGNSDPMPQSDASNEKLARSRGEFVANHLKRSEPLASRIQAGTLTIHVESEGSRRLARANCPMSGEKRALTECHAANRRATVRLVFTPPPKTSKKS